MITLSHQELANLLINAQRGDIDAFEKIYKTTYIIQYKIALKRTGDPFLAEEITQEVYINLFKTMKRIDNPMGLVNYLCKTNMNICTNKLKSNHQLFLDIDEIENINSYYVTESQIKDQKELLFEAMESLDNQSKEIIHLRYFEEFKIDEISHVTGKSPSTVARSIKHSLDVLRSKISTIRNGLFSFALLPFINFYNKKLSTNTQDTDFHYVSPFDLITSSVTSIALILPLFFSSNGVYASELVITPYSNSTYVANSMTYILNYSKLSTNQSFVVISTNIDDSNIYYELNLPYLTVYDNGDFTIQIVENESVFLEKKITVNTIDKEIPHLSVLSNNEQEIRLHIFDKGSGIDKNSLLLMDTKGNLVSHTLNILNDSTFEITIDGKYTNFTISVNDNVGNLATYKIYY